MIKLICKELILNGQVELPFSKSISNRLLIINYLARSINENYGWSDAEDTKILKEILTTLKPNDIAEFDVKNAGTAFRFLTALLSITPGNYYLTGVERMKKRPIKPMVDALRKLGANISYKELEGYPPLLIEGNENLNSELISISPEYSSQFISGLMMIAPLISGGLKFEMSDNQVSRPYIDMTLQLMKSCEIDIVDLGNTITIHQGKYHLNSDLNETDWSSAAFFYELISLSNDSELVMKGLSLRSIQGDSFVSEIFRFLGVTTTFHSEGIIIKKTLQVQNNIHVDFSNHPDLALPFIVACAGLGINGMFAGLTILAYKESSRMEALSTELQKIGIMLINNSFGEWILDKSSYKKNNHGNDETIVFEVYNDHRMAMCLSPLVAISKNIFIKNEDVVQKSFPLFWNELQKVSSIIIEEIVQ